MHETETYRDPSLLDIIKNLREDASTLLRQEIALAKREMAVKAVNYGKNAVFIGVGAVVGLYALFFLFFSCSNLLAAGLTAMGLAAWAAASVAPLAMALLLAGAALLLILKALKSMRTAPPLPQKTFDSLREDKDWIKDKVNA